MNDVLTWPVGRERHSRSSSSPQPRPPATPVLAYAAGASAGGALTGLVLGGAGMLASHARPLWIVLSGIATAVALTAVVLQARGRVRPLPQLRAQVPRYWLTWRRPAATALAFGAMIGSGVLTYAEYAVVYVLAAAVVVAASPGAGIAVGAIYGGSRGLAVGITWVTDRRGGTRPDWERLIDHGRSINAVLSIVGAASFAVVVAAAA